jgi:hypothetical protein
MKNVNLKNEPLADAKPVLCACYSTAHALEIINKFNSIADAFDKFRFISRCSGVKLVIKSNRYWFEFFGKQITSTDIYIEKSSFAMMLNIACT